MQTIERYFKELSHEELDEAFKEYEEWRRTGVLQDGVLRTTFNRFTSDHNIKGNIHMICEPFLYVVVKTYQGGK